MHRGSEPDGCSEARVAVRALTLHSGERESKSKASGLACSHPHSRPMNCLRRLRILARGEGPQGDRHRPECRPPGSPCRCREPGPVPRTGRSYPVSGRRVSTSPHTRPTFDVSPNGRTRAKRQPELSRTRRCHRPDLWERPTQLVFWGHQRSYDADNAPFSNCSNRLNRHGAHVVGGL